MDIKALRSQLTFLLGDDLKNLTLSDLKECNFRTSRLVLSSIVFAGRTLHDEAEQLTHINDIRTRKMGLLRNQPDTRDERRRVEEEYRHAFYEIILKILIDLQFPPASEPFSDPLGSLKEDIEFRLSSIQYLIDHVLVGSEGLTNMSHVYERSENCDSSDMLTNSIPPPPIDNSHVDDTLDIHPPPPLSSERIKSTPSVAQRSSSSNSARDSRTSQFEKHVDTGRASVKQIRSLDEYENLQKSYEVLQYHNMQLSKQLKLLQDAVCQRNAMEVKMDLLMRDFSSMVGEVADISNSSAAPLPSSSDKSLPPKTPPSKQINSSRPLGAVLEESATSRRKRPGSCNDSLSRNSSAGGDTVHWKQLQARINDVHNRWRSMRREAKRSVFTTVNVHSSASNHLAAEGFAAFPHGNNSRQQTSQGKSLQSSRTTQSSGRNSAFGDVGFGRESLSSKSSAGRSFTPRKTSTSQHNFSISEGGSSNNDPSCCASLRKILGVQLPLSFDDADDSNVDLNGEKMSEVSLDLPRIYQLQRDLVNFSRNAYTFSQLCDDDDDDSTATTSTGDVEMIPLQSIRRSLQKRLSRAETLMELRNSARTMLLHTSCLSPLLPLKCASPSLSSSATGLDSFVEMVQPMLEAKKAWSPTLQSAVDRAKSEQYSLLVSLSHSDMRMKQWQMLAGQLHPLISNFATKLSSQSDIFVKQLHDKSESLRSLSGSLAKAETIRLALPSSGSSQVSPIESLSRGYMGVEVADLINRLRMNDRDISQLSMDIRNVQQKVLTSISDEAAVLFKCGEAFYNMSTT